MTEFAKKQPQQPENEALDVTLLDQLRNTALAIRLKVGRIAGATLLVTGMTTAAYATEEFIDPLAAEAYNATTGDYPWYDATELNATNSDYGYLDCPANAANCKTNTITKNGNIYGVYDPWNYYFRNCTSYVAWRLSKEFNVNASGLGNANTWDDRAYTKGWDVDKIPEIGDVAVWGNSLYGHVALVEEIGTGANGGKVRVAEYNQGLNGKFRNDRWEPISNFIDVNGPNPEDFNLKVGGSGNGDNEVDNYQPADLAWWQGNTVFALPGPNFHTSTLKDGIAQPDWAGVLDYNQDGLDDLVIYRKIDGTIRIVEKNPNGGWISSADNPVRGPGFGEPAWAGTGDFDGDGQNDDMAWWTASGNVHKLIGPTFRTSTYETGIQPPDWADVMDYNNDGRDDVVFFRKVDGTIRVLVNNPNGGGWYSHANNPIRGPGFGQPEFAGVGDLDGDGLDDDIVWWAASGNVHKLVGPNFHTSTYTTGIVPPDWADIIDYNNDGRDDVVFYRKSTGTINILNNKTSGGWIGNTQNPIRGPGVGMPDWAVVGRFKYD
jgi:surface antigen